MPAKNLDAITVVLPTRNEARNIEHFLRSLPFGVHLLVVDASEDDTAERLEHLRPSRTTVIRRRGSISGARQLAVEQARTDWLLFTDADIVFPEGYFHRLLEQSEADAIYGPQLSRGRFRHYYWWFAFGQYVLQICGIPAASGSNLLVKRQAVLKAGGFDPDLGCNEDSELVWRIRRHGGHVRFAPCLAVHVHDHRRLESGLLRKMLHSVMRCVLLYWDLIPARWRRSDWGYGPTLRRAEEDSPARGE